MKQLYILKGAHGSGKTTFLKERGLMPYTISQEQLQMLFLAPALGLQKGKMFAERGNISNMILNLLEMRMQNGDTIFIDGVHAKVSEIQKYHSLIVQYGYECVIIDFSSVELETALKQNRLKDKMLVTPEYLIEQYYNGLETSKKQLNYQVLPYYEVDDYFQLISKPIKVDRYEAIVHIGDIHATLEPLQRFWKESYHQNHFYIFTGDFLDRGLDNVDTLKFFLSIQRLPNVLFLEGNHEGYLHQWAHNQKSRSLIFENETKKQLESAFVNKKEVRRFLRKLKDHFYYEYAGKKVLVTHGGLSFIPSRLFLTSSEQLIKGVGDFRTPIDSVFDENTEENEFQVHGHRNFGLKPFTVDTSSFNLEGAVENGGAMRVLTLTKNGFHTREYKNQNEKTLVRG